MTRFHRRLFAPIAALALVAVAIGCGGDDEDAGSPAPDYSALEKAPGALGKLYAEGDVLLDGGTDAFGERLDALRGTPVVVNKWASWCVPCRVEFPFFQRQAAKRGTEIAFIGVNSLDSNDAAETFLRDNPLPYPSYVDGDERLAEEIGAAPGFPATVFFDAESQRTEVHIGQYSSERDLAADIRRYAGGS
jgi:cytochrome c biogenesis protein CcmG/thiol:disulfide interchange protein DsbE